jgi:hypothetical protein
VTTRKRILFVLLALAAGSISEARADGKLTAARELAEWALRKFTGKATQEGAEALSRRIATAAAKHGDELVAAAVRKAGPRALSLADEAAEQAPRVLRFVGQYGDEGAAILTRKSMKLLTLGDDAAAALVRHKGVAEPLLESYGTSAVKALAAVGPRNGRRIAMMAERGDLAAIGRTPELLGVIGKWGEPAADFIWRNKGALSVATALAAFVANPQPFIDGTAQLTSTVAENAVKPAMVAAGNVAQGVMWLARWALGGLAAGLALGLFLVVRKRGIGVVKLSFALARRFVR